MDVAVKECFIREKIRRKVEREIEINAQLDFKYIIKTYGYFKKYGSTYFVMERATSDLEKELAKTVPTMETRKKEHNSYNRRSLVIYSSTRNCAS